MKKLLVVLGVVLLLIILGIVLFSRFSGTGIRLTDGRYVGYSEITNEWLLMEYQNVPIGLDGPYVFEQDNAYFALTLASDIHGQNSVEKQALTHQVQVTVDSPAKAQFSVPLRHSYPRSELEYAMPDKLLAISDIEGNFDAFVDLLVANQVIDTSFNWIFGTGQLVLIGDMVDRGSNVVPVLWLIYKLEAEAEHVGGKLHYVLGNHERYLLDGRTKSVARKYFGTYRATGQSQRALWTEQSVLGRWLRSKPVALKVGDSLFVHGGISPEVLATKPTLSSMDKEAAESFVTHDTVNKNSDNSILHGSRGLLFYRGLAKDMSHYELGEKASSSHVAQLLDAFAVKRVAIGHTLTEQIGWDYNGGVIRVDVAHSDGVSEALLMEDGALYRVNAEGERFALTQISDEMLD
ncbi:metallophosphoesterase [Bowmanella denitrificans]|uniref:metallophosphoesterase n=1 Tax=Bowmanella denitrificans TaxID=366582 RepID=UPI0031E063BA